MNELEPLKKTDVGFAIWQYAAVVLAIVLVVVLYRVIKKLSK